MTVPRTAHDRIVKGLNDIGANISVTNNKDIIHKYTDIDDYLITCKGKGYESQAMGTAYSCPYTIQSMQTAQSSHLKMSSYLITRSIMGSTSTVTVTTRRDN